MEKTILKLNHILFRWYYKRTPEFFRKWTLFKSISLLIQNYEHRQLLFENEVQHNQNLTKDNDELRKELFDIRIKQIAPEGTIDSINKAFGTNIHKNSEN